MAVERLSRVKSLAFTYAGAGGATVTLSELQSAEIEDGRDLPTMLIGDAEVESHYQGPLKASITIETAKLSSVVGIVQGRKVTNVTLIAHAAAESDGTLIGGLARRVMSAAVIAEKTGPSLSNADKKPVTMKLKFVLSRLEGESSDPTFGAWEAVP